MAAFVINKVVVSDFSRLADRECSLSAESGEEVKGVVAMRKHIMSILLKVLAKNVEIAEN